jgi:hypothetical protein
VPHAEPIDRYTLRGPSWEGVWLELTAPTENGAPAGVHLWWRNFRDGGLVDLYRRTIDFQRPPRLDGAAPTIVCARGSDLFYGVPVRWDRGRSAGANMYLDARNLVMLQRESIPPLAGHTDGLYLARIGSRPLDAELLAIPGNPEDVIVQAGTRVALLQGSVTADNRYVLRRLGTSLAEPMARQLFAGGLDRLLALETQRTLREAAPAVEGEADLVLDRSGPPGLDFAGPYGVYLREVFFHVPMLIADHLNAQGRFAAAQRFLRFVFDPTADEVVDIPAGTPADERARMQRDRVWRYLELRGLDAASLRSILTDAGALARLRRQPFNPHAIARLRPSAYQRWVVMKYVGNLLDWADHLFTQFTAESVGEATVLYQTAAQILGPRPAALGPCGEGGVTPRDYEHIVPWLDGVDDLLVEVESWALGERMGDGVGGGDWHALRPAIIPGAFDHTTLVRAREKHPLRPRAGAEAAIAPAGGPAGWAARPALGWAPALSATTTRGGERGVRDLVTARPPMLAGTASVVEALADGANAGGRTITAQRFCGTLVRQLSPVFCVPPNRALWSAWDRVDDRLFKIHHCMDITGQRRQLELLDPESDPLAMTARPLATLTADERSPTSSGALPPYRFAYLIDRAKSAAGAVAGFGSALLAALEKRDGEALARLRTVQQKNLTAASTRLREWEIDLAREGLDVAERQHDAAIVRRDQLQGLIEAGASAWENADRVSRGAAQGLRASEASLGFLAGVMSFLPDIGSPFAFKYGGTYKGGGLSRLAVATGTLATIADAAAALSGTEGGIQRRAESWRRQLALARLDVGMQERQVAAARLRVQSAERGLALHQQSLAQVDEVLASLDGKVTNLELYAWYARELQRLHRDAFDHAMAMARLAEQALRFERSDQGAGELANSYWEPGRAGLLAGERLLLDLQAMDRHFLETNHRQLELDQTFSLAQIAPEALVALRATGTCELAIPELFFDLAYPGQYRRRIRAVRLTIPCVTGPFTNVGATLELLDSHVRPTPALDGALVPVPPRRTTTIATSSAQGDAGVFELSFRDERYMPFEGAGAISHWRLRLPATFRSFDYATITDVMLSINYTALHDEDLRGRVEAGAAQLEGTLRHALSTRPLRRILSLRQDASATFTRLLRSAPGTPVALELAEHHLPSFLRGRTVVIDGARVGLRTSQPDVAHGLVLRVDGVDLDTWSADPALGGLPAAALPPAFFAPTALRTHSLAVTSAGTLAAATGALGSRPRRRPPAHRRHPPRMNVVNGATARPVSALLQPAGIAGESSSGIRDSNPRRSAWEPSNPPRPLTASESMQQLTVPWRPEVLHVDRGQVGEEVGEDQAQSPRPATAPGPERHLGRCALALARPTPTATSRRSRQRRPADARRGVAGALRSPHRAPHRIGRRSTRASAATRTHRRSGCSPCRRCSWRRRRPRSGEGSACKPCQLASTRRPRPSPVPSACPARPRASARRCNRAPESHRPSSARAASCSLRLDELGHLGNVNERTRSRRLVDRRFASDVPSPCHDVSYCSVGACRRRKSFHWAVSVNWSGCTAWSCLTRASTKSCAAAPDSVVHSCSTPSTAALRISGSAVKDTVSISSGNSFATSRSNSVVTASARRWRSADWSRTSNLAATRASSAERMRSSVRALVAMKGSSRCVASESNRSSPRLA